MLEMKASALPRKMWANYAGWIIEEALGGLQVLTQEGCSWAVLIHLPGLRSRLADEAPRVI